MRGQWDVHTDWVTFAASCTSIHIHMYLDLPPSLTTETCNEASHVKYNLDKLPASMFPGPSFSPRITLRNAPAPKPS